VLRTGEAFQTIGSVTQVVFDKTGTLTEGAFTVREVEATGDRDELLAVAASAEVASEHLIAAAIVASAREQGLALPVAQEFEAITGRGVRATIDGSLVLVGRPSFVAEHVHEPAGLAQRAGSSRRPAVPSRRSLGAGKRWGSSRSATRSGPKPVPPSPT
jgi:P-type E1-E2 ATPase